jgi:hypothetical protein
MKKYKGLLKIATGNRKANAIKNNWQLPKIQK